MTIAEVKKLKEGMPVVDLRARFVRAFERKTGEGEYGQWSLQNFEIEDESGKLIVLAKDRPEDFTELDWQGQEIILSAVKMPKGWTGAVTFNDEYNEKITRKIKLTKSGVCRLATADDSPPPSAPEATPEKPQNNVLDLDTACDIMRIVQNVGKELYPDAPEAAAAIGNTLFIAVSHGRITVATNREKS